MNWAFIIPFAGGIIAELSYHIKFIRYKALLRQLLAGAVVWFTLGSMFNGVLEIYGTSNRLITIYPVAGLIHLIIAGIVFISALIF